MPPQTLRYPSLAPDAAADDAGSGRHRRPESLAEVSRPRVAFVGEPRTDEVPVPTPRSARHQRAVPAQRTRRPDSGPRHTASHRAAAVRPPVTGSHRAPGTLPIESWLLMGKTRQQVLLASLVAAGLLLLALPTGRAVTGIDAVDAAAQRAIGTHAEKSTKDTGKTGGKQDAKTGTDQATPAKPAGAPIVPSAAPTGAAKHDERADGPGQSLRTTGSTAIALTFDDGPDPVQTPKILAMLDQYQIKATFCLVGQQVRKHPEVVRQIVAAGHTLCNHTWDHSLTIGKDKPEQIRADLARTTAAIEAAAPGAKIPFFRAPGGNFTDRLVSVAGGTGMTSLYWEVDPQDWDHRTGETDPAHVARVIADVKKHTKPGAIILSHDFNQPDTIEAYAKLLPWLTENFTIGIPGQPGAAPSTPPATDPTPPVPDPAASPDPAATPTPAGAAAQPAG